MPSSLVKFAILSTLVSVAFAATVQTRANSKRGIAYAVKNGNDNSHLGSQSSWIYAWSASPPSYLKTGMEFIPMQWGSADAGSFINTVTKSGAKTILGFNEPDQGSDVGGSNIDPNTAASIWKANIEPLAKKGVRLGAPAVSAGPNGQPWLKSFLSACSGCTIDFIPLHWYGDGAQNFENYVNSFSAAFPGKPLWVTEYASTNANAGATTDFLKQTVAWLDSNSKVERYSWFAFERDDGSNLHYSLLDGSGNPNDKGKAYL